MSNPSICELCGETIKGKCHYIDMYDALFGDFDLVVCVDCRMPEGTIEESPPLDLSVFDELPF